MTSSFPIGKVPASFLETLWKRHPATDASVILGPGIGRDVAVLDVGDRYLVAKTDPITFTTDRIGWYAVHINANDVACSGAQPAWFLATLLLPPGQADGSLIETIFAQITDACQAVGAELVGGHTEVTHGITRPIVMGCLLGMVNKDSLITTAGAQPGDTLLVTGGIPIEGTAIIAREWPTKLSAQFDSAFLERSRNLLFDPGISVLPAAKLAISEAEVHAMHDPTEGGLATGLWELAQASGVDLEIETESIPIIPEGKALCDALSIDPLATIASGALLLAVAPEGIDRLLAAYRQREMVCQPIGQVIAGSGQVTMIEGDRRRQLQVPERDEIAKLFD
ncbi:MAG: AIR synthase family protein [Anaerolineales bacterium]